MDEQALRELVREAVGRHLVGADAGARTAAPVRFVADASSYRYNLPKTDGPCLIEPAVQCNHCGYCESHGH
jgi:hypothetical protein